ncbi:MAG: hypothetical protein IJD19_06950 [Ruminococcus sp.]|nr:hypothetical protein [Ruminococcus sp.]
MLKIENTETTITGRSKKLTALEPYIASVSKRIVSNSEEIVNKKSFADDYLSAVKVDKKGTPQHINAKSPDAL